MISFTKTPCSALLAAALSVHPEPVEPEQKASLLMKYIHNAIFKEGANPTISKSRLGEWQKRIV